ncbi:2-hydroxyacid dehydrogenase [Mammaliicoccus sciuri]|uniref:2-hydroxyacid dehydrogenase n=1 Tax=Mammaliicoccus sciuri TaxID=1296 RepID=UPI001E4717A9|nr:2-hydroxyacid dehydrogenase [Mammaliicoccus sciuri]MCD8801767.1 2-hydroxyacid dehydrogenase [Mammaliicoccus sciuri]
MKCLAISDLFIDKDMMDVGLQELKNNGIDVTIREWKHDDLEQLQLDNIKLEKNGPDVVELPEELLNDAETFDIVITQFAPINQQTIDKFTSLKILGVLRAGIENVDHAYAEKAGVKVFNTPGRSITSVSEFTVGMILSEIRNIAKGHFNLKQGKWEKHYPNGVLAPEIKNSKVGIIGYGAIGQRVADLLRPFGGEILYFDEYYDGQSEDRQVNNLNDLVKEADIITMHYRLTDTTKDMLNKEHFKIMKESAVVINTARSGLINEEDLIKALESREIAGAAVDVYEKEPLPLEHPYNKLDNITITPHIAGSTIGNFANSPVILGKIILENIK